VNALARQMVEVVVPDQSLPLEVHHVNVLFWIINDTKWRFARTLNENQLSQLLEILKTIEHRGNNLLESLKIIHA
jgi:hypothetical protein